MVISPRSLSPPAVIANNQSQKSSLSLLSRKSKYALYEKLISASSSTRYEEIDLEIYHRVSCRPIIKCAEDDMELLSDLITWGEFYLNTWRAGVYVCSKCSHPLYSSRDKYHGPCVWPSFRQPLSEHALSLTTVYPAASSLATDLKTLEKKEIHTLTRIGGTESCLCPFDSFPIVTIHHDL
eukprot:gene39024-52725_t